MTIQKKLAVTLAFVVMTCGGFQTVWGAPLPQPGTLGKPIPISIPHTRANEKFDLLPQPGFEVTLLSNYTVHFAWSDKTAGNMKKFVIRDGNGKPVFAEEISGNSIDIVPSKISLAAGQKYFWSVNDNARPYEFTILDEQTENELLENLAAIDAENLSSDERILKKAEYLQMLSDALPETIDLYWLVAQWISEISPTDENLAVKKAELLTRCAQHLDAEMW